jgi:probable FeS assembly SUF system protein SufT
MSTATVKLVRDCKAMEIPQGTETVLAEGTEVRILQSLGDSHTVITERRQMLKIAAADSDALGVGPPPKTRPAMSDAERQSLEERCLEALETCYDPELPVNVVDLGLVYACQVTPLAAGGSEVLVVMTVTSPGCGMADILVHEIRQKLSTVEGVAKVEVEIVFDPPWTPDRMTDTARLMLGMM